MTLKPADGPGCVVWRLTGSELSYAEIIHPADFHHDEVQWAAPAGSARVRLGHRLFPESLEKGVILRRVRGIFSSRQNDLEIAAAAYAAFAAAEPPLDAY